MTKDRITSRANPLVKRLRALAADRKARESEGLYLCEGEVMLGEALASEAAMFCMRRGLRSRCWTPPRPAARF